MCEILVSICDILTWIFNLIDRYRDNDGGLSAFRVVKYIKCLTGISLKNESDLKEYRLMALRFGFWPSSVIVYVWNIVEAVLIFEDKQNDTVFVITNMFVGLSLFALGYCLFLVFFLINCGDTLEDIRTHQEMLMIYHILDMIVDLTLLIAACSYTPVNPDLKSRFAIFIYSILDIMLSLIQVVVIVISRSKLKEQIQPQSKQ